MSAIEFKTDAGNHWSVNVEPDTGTLTGNVWINISVGPTTVYSFIPHDSAISIANALLSAAQASKEPA